MKSSATTSAIFTPPPISSTATDQTAVPDPVGVRRRTRPDSYRLDVGGHTRVGLEESLWNGPGKLAESNAAQVRRIRTVLEALSLEVATLDDARQILQIKGSDKVRFKHLPRA